MIAPAKPWYRSRTMLLNGFGLLAVIAGCIVNYARGGGVVDPTLLLVSGGIVSVNLYLRSITSTAIAGTPAAATPPPPSTAA